jgi:hypothetical protein
MIVTNMVAINVLEIDPYYPTSRFERECDILTELDCNKCVSHYDKKNNQKLGEKLFFQG